MSSLAKSLKRVIVSDEGNIESSMALIPLLILFLIGMQFSITSHSRNIEKLLVQDDANIRAISGIAKEGDRYVHIDSSGDSQNLDLLITHRESHLRNILSGVLGIATSDRSVDVQGIAIIENRR
jgi:hypothetical protein